jgi:hypothetical protein
MTQPPARRREAKTNSIFKHQQKTKFQKFGPDNHPPVNTKTKSKRKNDKKTQKPKSNQSQKCSLPQPYRTKAYHLARSKNVPNIPKFWLTSSSSSEFGQNYTGRHFDSRQKLRPQNNFLTDQHSNTMPKTKTKATTKLDVIRLQQSAVVTNLVEIARYTHTNPVYTEMTQEQFNQTIRNLNRITKLCARSIRATRHGQRIAPKVGPYAHYYRLFDDFCEILQLESDRILTQKEYLLDHEYRLVPKPPTPPKITGIRNIVNYYSGESDEEDTSDDSYGKPDSSDSDETDYDTE